MDIKNVGRGVIAAYQNISHPKPQKETEKRTSNTDKVEFDAESTLAAAKTRIVNELSANASPERIGQLKAVYADANSPADSAAVAAAIISR